MHAMIAALADDYDMSRAQAVREALAAGLPLARRRLRRREAGR